MATSDDNELRQKLNRLAADKAPRATATIVAPPVVHSTGTRSFQTYNAPDSGGGGGSSYDPYAAAQAAAAAATAKAQQAGKDQSARENANTQAIIDALRGTLKGYATGRDTQISNANKSFDATLRGVLSNYQQAVEDYGKTGVANEQDEASKSAANITNRARERTSLLEQAASQGAGETDQLRAQLQAFNNADANQLEIARSFYDTQRSINSQLAGANSQAETSRRSAWNQQQEAVGTAWNEFWKNNTDVWTNIQRTAAQNSNIDSDYSVGFKANTGGVDPIKEAAKYAGKTYEIEDKDPTWFGTWDGKAREKKQRLTSANSAAATTISAPKAAEGATLRSEW